MLGVERIVFCVKSRIHRERQYQALSECLKRYKERPKLVRDEMVGLMVHELNGPYYGAVKALRFIGIISPMLGLLGTIVGIIAAFKAIALQVGPITPSVIADGLWEAMLTTAFGLGIALPSLLIAQACTYLSERELNGFCLRLNRLSLSFELEKSTAQTS